jgi:hypothetical protein
MMWLLIVASCIVGEIAPECGGAIGPVRYATFSACEDAAVRYDDHMLAAAEASRQTVLLLETRCLSIASGAPT